MYSGVGYAKMDYPTQWAICHCQRERGKEMWAERKGEQGERESEGHRIERIGCEGLGKDR